MASDEGISTFPCCGKNAVEIAERPTDSFQSHPHEEQEEKETELSAENLSLPEQETPHGEEPDLDPCPDLIPDLIPDPDLNPDPHPDPCPDLISDPDLIPEPHLDPAPDLNLDPHGDPAPDSDLKPQATRKPEEEKQWHPEPISEAKVVCYREKWGPQSYRIETLQLYMDELSSVQKIKPWNISANYKHLEEEPVTPTYCSIGVQTSEDLFWANKLIQTSQHSLQCTVEMLGDKSPPEQKSIPPTQPLLPGENTQLSPSPHVPCANLPTAMDLKELINLATSLAMASSGNIDLPTLENLIRASLHRDEEPIILIQTSDQSTQFEQSTQTDQPASENQELPEKLPEAGELHEPWTWENSSIPCHLYFSQPGVKKATFKGKVKFLQPLPSSTQLQEVKEDSVPSTKKGNPLLLKIHFKLSSPSAPEK
uniref:spermatogenesis-associated protein 32 n=1 Tax=Jaculus jaculus TaxID=51337 RepID=UPI001E1B5F73|nr:spermatogenesis-associated protein 32 [Jaculus jaculus]